MKNFKLAMFCLALAVTAMAVTDAEAGNLKKPKKSERTEKTEEMKKPHRFENLPDMAFLGGTLSRDAQSGWRIGDTPLYLHKDCLITMAGMGDGWLEEGREAVVMGSMVGGAISAWSINVAQPDYKTMDSSPSKELKEAGPNPNVGVILNRVD